MLLDMLGVAHRIIPPRDDPPAEPPVDDPVTYAVNHALEKARSVAETMETAAVVLGADTIVIVDGDVLEKPADE
jgi:predicted house-cleaning NTP pyrophosphatase (Maf/HAM1 superfamily)